MDPSRFDTLARSIAQTGTRRWLMLRLAAASLLGVLAAGDGEEAEAERPQPEAEPALAAAQSQAAQQAAAQQEEQRERWRR